MAKTGDRVRVIMWFYLFYEVGGALQKCSANPLITPLGITSFVVNAYLYLRLRHFLIPLTALSYLSIFDVLGSTALHMQNFPNSL